MTVPGVPPRLARQALRFAAIGVLSTLAYLLLFLLARPSMGAQAANLRRAAGHRGRQHRREPAVHLRRARRRRGPAPAAGPGRVRPRAGADQRRAGAADAARAATRPAASRCACWSPPTCSRPSCDSSCCANGCSASRLEPGSRHGTARHRPGDRHGCPMTTTSASSSASPPPSAVAGAHRPRRGSRRSRRDALDPPTRRRRNWQLGLTRRAAGRHRAALPLGPRRVRLRQRLLRRRRAGRHEELEGVLLRLVRLVELHHRRQAAGVAVADGDRRPDLRLQLVVDARAAGARGRAGRSGCCTPRCALVRALAPACSPAALLALTPVAVLMFRFNNPDALMTLLIVVAAYCMTRAIEDASTRWLRARRADDGLRVPGQGAAAVHRAAGARARLPGRRADVAGAGGCCNCSAPARRAGRRRGWWVLAVAADAGRRPSLHRRLGEQPALGLAFGYNGLVAHCRGDVRRRAAAAAVAASAASTGIGRLFNSLNGGQIAWLLPAALIGDRRAGRRRPGGRRAPTAPAPP